MLLFSLRMPKICRQNIRQNGLITTQVGKMQHRKKVVKTPDILQYPAF